MLDSTSIPIYLHFGYVPTSEDVLSSSNLVLVKESMHLPFQKSCEVSNLVKDGIKALDKTITDSVTNLLNYNSHVLPLSGGLDSRAILGGLLKNLDSSQIQLISIGSPKTWDFEIGQKIAKSTGLRYEAVDLSSISWDTKKLVQFAIQFGRPSTVFTNYLFSLIWSKYGKDKIYWSGFMGDPLAGSHLLPVDSNSWKLAIEKFAARESYSKNVQLTPPGFQVESLLPQKPLLKHTNLSYDEQLDFAVRQQCYIKPIVLFEKYNCQAPFLGTEWVKFILNVPRQYRWNQNLYKEILKQAYPKLFSLPTKTNFGLPLSASRLKSQFFRLLVHVRYSVAHRFFRNSSWSVHPATNYIDFDESLRARKDLKTVVYENLQDLKKRDIVGWIDIDKIWTRHQQRAGDYSDALTLLASLEINLKAQEVCAK